MNTEPVGQFTIKILELEGVVQHFENETQVRGRIATELRAIVQKPKRMVSWSTRPTVSGDYLMGPNGAMPVDYEVLMLTERPLTLLLRMGRMSCSSFGKIEFTKMSRVDAVPMLIRRVGFIGKFEPWVCDAQ